jgi:hypothetical protein
MPLNPAGIQADKPIPPWEQPGCFRLDCEPHRSGLLYCLAWIGLILSLVSSVTLGLPLLVAFPVSLATWTMARRDLALMLKGLMDPQGEKRTRQALHLGLTAFLCCCGFVVVFLWLVLSAMVGR